MSSWDIVVVVVWLALLAVIARTWRRDGRIPVEGWLFLGTTSIWWLEAPWDWVLLVRYNPEHFLMLPRSWPVLNIAGGLPANAPFIYGVWFTLPAMLARRMLATRSWPTWAIVSVVIAFGAAFEGVSEYVLFLRPGRYYYTHVIHGLAFNQGQPTQYPLDVPLWVGAYVGLCCFILIRASRLTPVASRDRSAVPDRVAILVGAPGELTESPSGQPLVEHWWKRLNQLRAFGGPNDRILSNVLTTLVFYNLTYALTTVPALITRIATWRDIPGDPMPFGHVPWPGLR